MGTKATVRLIRHGRVQSVVVLCCLFVSSFGIWVRAADVDANDASCAVWQSKLDKVTQEVAYCQATSSATEIRERMLLERLERMEAQTEPLASETCTADTAQLQALQATISQLETALESSKQKVEQMTGERHTLQSTNDDLNEQMATLQASLDQATIVQENHGQLQSQHDQVVSEASLLRQRIQELEHAQDTAATHHQGVVDRAHADGRASAVAQVTFWVTQYNHQTTALGQMTRQQQDTTDKLHAVQRDLFDVRRAWHARLERERTEVLRRQLLVQTLVIDPWQHVCETVWDPAGAWLDRQPAVTVVREQWRVVAHEQFPVWKRDAVHGTFLVWNHVVEALDAFFSPHIAAALEATKEPREQAWTVYETVVLPSPVVQTVLAAHSLLVRLVADVLVIVMHSIFPHLLTPTRGSAMPGTLARVLQMVEENPKEFIVGAELLGIAAILVSVLRWFRRNKPVEKP